MQSDGTQAAPIAELPVVAMDPVWSPDGSTIAFWSESDASVYSISARGTSITRLTTDGFASSPAWSPDGAFIAYQSQHDEPPEIFVMRADGSDQVRITSADDGISAMRPSWLSLPVE